MPRKWTDFRPISLCKCLYKIFSKIIAVRLSDFLPVLISPEQGVFIKGRAILENIALAQELLREVNRKNRGGNVVLKLDMEKAYDKFDWNYLKQVLLHFSFCDRWVQLVENCWASCWFSVLINGESTSFFESSRGLRQGDPLSPSLFILGADVLSCGLHNLMSNGGCLPFSLGRGCQRISHLLYADDTLLFLNGGRASMRKIVALLDEYQSASGQLINKGKSSFLCSNKIPVSRIHAISSLLRIARSTGTFSHLGVPLSVGRLKSSAFQPLVDKVRGRIKGWTARILSQAGRMVLIKHVLSSIPIHSMAASCIPNQGWSEGKRKLHWKSWKTISMPKEEGGLGIRKLADMMQAFNIKMAWVLKFHKDSSLWASFLATKYNFSHEPMRADLIQRRASPFLKQILSKFALIDDKVQWNVGVGDCNFWQANWTSLGPLQNFLLSDVVATVQPLKVNQVLGPSGPLPPSIALSMLLNEVTDFIFHHGFCISAEPDYPLWPFTSSGSFSVKTAWNVSRLSGPSKEWAKWAGISIMQALSVQSRIIQWRRVCAGRRIQGKRHLYTPAFILWELRKFRNGAFFDDRLMNHQSIITKVLWWLSCDKEEVARFRFSQCLQSADGLHSVKNSCRNQLSPTVIRWQKPPTGYGLMTNTGAEFKAVHDGLFLCLEKGLSQIIVESDSDMVIKVFNEGAKIGWARKGWKTITDRLNRLASVNFKYTFREGNGMADGLARVGTSCLRRPALMNVFLGSSSVPRFTSHKLSIVGYPPSSICFGAILGC
ncbi:uncharacterized protein LOC131225851 [Magnolia sinica]|uniref:uncharacterized protein LOC131225851 n=1 Tax=Magnolia sinica TaxID=86752 RepID=UPI002657E56D|nr:uncharacterized protein LOC131225851 [Magnolia sinica]